MKNGGKIKTLMIKGEGKVLRRKTKILMVCLLGTALFTGCAYSPELMLTEEEQKLIAGYSADILLKYSDGYAKSLVDTAKERELQAAVAALLAQKQAEEADEGKNTDHKSESGEEGVAESPYAPRGEQDLAAALSQSGIEVSYDGFDVCKSYPSESEAEDAFLLNATDGKDLVVYRFRVSNTSGEDMEANILDQNPMFRIIVNGEERKNVLKTMLLNDLGTLHEVIPAGESRDEVLVMEVPEGYVQTIETVSLLIKANGQESVIPLLQ